MKKSVIFAVLFLMALVACQRADKEQMKQQVYQTEKAFEKMVADSNVAVAFSHFADTGAVILRGNDSIIKGKEAIQHFYQAKVSIYKTLLWTPDFIEVSDDGTLAHSYGKYSLVIRQPDSVEKEYHGIFHTVWKRQKDGSWKYVWD